MSETSSGGSAPSSLPQCKYCSTPLPAITTPFCGKCGEPQMETKHCIRCRMELPVSNKFCFQCRQDQTQPLPRKPCLLCGTLLPANAQNCAFCSAPQDPHIMLSFQLKYCHNQNCQTALMYGLTVCYKCRSQQPMPPPMHLLIKAEPPNPQMMPPHYPQLPYVFPPATPHPTMTDPRLSGQQMHQPLPGPQPLMSLPTQPVGDTNRWQQMPEVVVDYQPPHSNASITSLPPNPTSETHSQSQISVPIQGSKTLPNEPPIPPVTSDQKLTPMDVDQSSESPSVPTSTVGTSSTSVVQTDITPIPPVTSDQKLTVTPMDVDQSGESPSIPTSTVGTSSTSVLQTDITPGLNLPVQEDNKELKLPNSPPALTDSPVLTQDPSQTKVDSSPPINGKRSSNVDLPIEKKSKTDDTTSDNETTKVISTDKAGAIVREEINPNSKLLAQSGTGLDANPSNDPSHYGIEGDGNNSNTSKTSQYKEQEDSQVDRDSSIDCSNTQLNTEQLSKMKQDNSQSFTTEDDKTSLMDTSGDDKHSTIPPNTRESTLHDTSVRSSTTDESDHGDSNETIDESSSKTNAESLRPFIQSQLSDKEESSSGIETPRDNSNQQTRKRKFTLTEQDEEIPSKKSINDEANNQKDESNDLDRDSSSDTTPDKRIDEQKTAIQDKHVISDPEKSHPLSDGEGKEQKNGDKPEQFVTPPSSPKGSGSSLSHEPALFIGVESDSDSVSSPIGESNSPPKSKSEMVVYQKKSYEEQEQLFPGINKGKKDKNKNKKDDADPQKNVKKSDNKNLPVVWKDIPRGFKVNPEDAVTVTFHALLPMQLWKWDERSEVYIRFGSDKLGLWECDCGPMQTVRDAGDNLLEMQCSLKINYFDLIGKIPYKYRVYTPKTTEAKSKDAPYEFVYSTLSDVPAEYANRVLEVPYEYQKGQSHYEQYDTMIYPGLSRTKIEEGKSWGKKVKDVGWGMLTSVKGLFGGQSGPQSGSDSPSEAAGNIPEDVFPVPEMEEMRKKCLEVYMAKYLVVFKSGIINMSLTPDDIIRNICHIYGCLYSPTIQDGTPRKGHTRDWKFGNLKHELKKLLLSVVEHLKTDGVNNSPVISASLILCCLHSIKIDIAHNAAVGLLQLFVLEPDLDARQCPDLDILWGLFSKNHDMRSWFLHGLLECCNNLMSVKVACDHISLFMNMLAIYHFIRGDCKPFDNPEGNPFKMVWIQTRLSSSEFPVFPLQKLKDVAKKAKFGFSIPLYSELKPLFVMDPLLLPNFVYICPENEYSKLFTVLPPFLSIMRTAYLFQMRFSINVNDAKNIQHLLEIILKSLDEEAHQLMFMELLNILNSSSFLIGKLNGKLKHLTDSFVQPFVSSLSLTLKVLSLVVNSCDDSNESKALVANKKDSVYQKLNEAINIWIGHVVGGLHFGCSIKSHYVHLYRTNLTEFEKARQEFEAWDHILSVDCSQDLLSDWHQIVLSIIRKRVAPLDSQFKVELFTRAEQRKSSPAIVNMLMEEVAEGLDDLFLKQGGRYAEDSLSKLQQSKHMSTLLGNMLEKKYPKAADSLDIDAILGWELWPGFMKIYERHRATTTTRKGLSELDQDICYAAINIFKGVCCSVLDGTVTSDLLKKLKEKKEQVQKLCEAITVESQGESEKPLSPDHFTYEAIKIALDERLEEYNYFLEYHKKLKHICNHLDGLSIEGFQVLKDSLRQTFETTKISSLCSSEDGRMVVKCFPAAEPLDPILNQFQILSQKFLNDTFLDFWRAEKETLEATPMLIDDIVSNVWTPTFQKCVYFLESLRSRSIKLADVDQLLLKYTPQQLESNIKHLEIGVCECIPKQKTSQIWIRVCIKRMQQYRSLCEHANAAEAFLKVKTTLGLTGDFSVVEKLAAEFTASVEDKNLEYISDAVIDTGEFLHGISSNPRRMKCLEVFAKCQPIVRWIRQETKDVTDLQNFVTIALATAAGGEDDFTRDRLSNLRTVGSGFATLIYRLPENTGYKELEKRCVSLWEALQRKQNLPSMMEGCNEHIDWYQSVKETQGSVEKSSFDKMKNIKHYGYYTVGSHISDVHTKLKDVIRLDLKQRDKQLTQLKYSLDELRDLESKLVLITGQESKEREDVDLFMDTFHSVCRIGEVLMELQQQGNAKYVGWTMKFSCRGKDIVDKLQDIAKEMEDDQHEWKEEIRKTRQEFYHLNYYTTKQLLSMRRELGRFKDGIQDQTIKPEVMALLRSISREVNQDIVKEHLYNIILLLGEQEAYNESALEHLQTISTHVQSKHKVTTPTMQHNIHHPGLEKYSNNNDDNKISTMKSKVFEDIMKAEVVSDAPVPQLKEEELTDKQKAIIANVKQDNGFHRKLIMLAFDRCAKPDIQDDVEEWCLEHTEDFVYPDSEADSDAMTEPYFGHSDDDDVPSEDEREEEEEEAVKMDEDTPIEPPPMEIEPEVRQKSVKVRITERIPVDENHPGVVELHNTGFDLDLCIEAITLYPHDISFALDYLNDRSDQGKLFEASREIIDLIHVIGDSGMSLEESTVEDGGYGRQDSRTSDISPTSEEIEIIRSETSAKSYLSLLEIGMILEQVSETCKSPVSQSRTFPEGLKVGEYNLLVVPPENVLKSTLSLYKHDTTLPMPTYEEVLLCNEQTTDEEVTLLWKRALGDPNHFRIFCLVHAEKLSYQTCDKTLRNLQELSQGEKDYRLVIICSNEDEDKSHMVSKLQLYRRPLTTVYSDRDFASYLKHHFTTLSRAHSGKTLASEVDPIKSYVRVVTSERAGMGKSLYICRMKELLASKTSAGPHEIIIPIHGPKVTTDTIVEALKEEVSNTRATIFHLDISPSVLWQVDSILFSLLVLQAICDSQGRIWRCHPAHLYAIEVTIPKSEQIPAKRTIALLNILPSIKCVSPRSVLQTMRNSREDPYVMSMDDKEFRSSVFQRVFQYLRRHIGRIPLDRFTYPENSIEGRPMDCLEVLLGQCGVKDPSWGEIKHFVCFLDTQLRSCEKSVFCDENIVGDVMTGLKTFAVKFMIRMSKDFATSSLKGEVAAENEEEVQQMEDLQEYQIDERKQWEQNYHPYLFFNEDGMSITFVGFNANRTGDLLDPVRGQIIEGTAMTPQLYTGLQQNRVNLSENYQTWDKGIMIQKIGMVMGLEWMPDPDTSYVLTVDNVIKILAIHMRFRCNIPVVIMGETGCGKTRLIRYMCDLAAQGCRQGGAHVRNMLIMKVHGGTTEADIVKKVKDAENVSVENRNTHKIDTVLFFDEANTTEAIGLIKEVMCDRRINGRPVAENVKFIAACNPYKKHTEEMIEKLESAGLGFYVKATETQQKLGKIPLRQLVYRVLDLPPSMRPLVYDFGQLNNATERDYTRQIVKGRCSAIADVTGRTNIIEAVSHVLAWNQSYMRNRKDECSFVSLRDVERTMIVFRYFCEKADKFQDLVTKKALEEEKQATDAITRALILSLSVCYHARLQDREEYEEAVVSQFRPPLALTQGREQFCDEMRWCQDVLLGNMKLGPNIARNAALRENVFMMAVCIELRIPLFLVGKPGSSKSLAKSIVADSMLGRSSDKPLLKELKEVHMFSYQCSQLSTPESVIEVFNTAKSFQKKQDTANYVSVVVLDEVGLAEDSPNLPLKALHPLLEDGTAGGDDSQQIIDRQQRVAFIGISNWALDPAKMNRGVMVTRGDPDKNELELSARGICSNRVNDPVKDRLNPYFKPLAAAYKNICEEQDRRKRAFFGLRDFYSLIKMLYWMCEKSNCPLTGPQLEHAIKRNFGGLDSFNTYEIFMNYLGDLGSNPPDLSNASEERKEILHPDCTPLGLIKTSLRTKEITWHGENRYLLFLTENYAALQVLKHYLHEVVGLSSNVPISAGLEEEMREESVRRRRMEPFVLFGSSFPKDREYTQVCRNINQIKICMETGRTVILLNLENLYESLYDLLNQYYIVLGGTRYVDLGLQTHRVKCRVHNDFKLILIAEKGTVYEKFPTPLINRLEKHFVLTETVLLDWQKEVLIRLEEWIKQFSTVTDSNSSFKTQDAFVGFQNDTPASVIFQATEQLSDEEFEETEEWREAVFKCSCEIVLQMASPDALIRLQRTVLAEEAEELSEMYFSEQCHGSIVQFLQHHLQTHTANSDGLLIQVTTHSHLLSNVELTQLYQCIEIEENLASCFLLQEFDTELDFSNKVSPAFSRDSRDKLLIVQCDSGHLYGDLIACARYRVDDEREKANLQRRLEQGEKANLQRRLEQGTTHVLFIIHLPRRGVDKDKESSSFVGFQGGAWISAHIDDIRAPTEAALTLDEALSAPISELFYNIPFTSNGRPVDTSVTHNRRVLEPVSKTGIELEVEEQRNEFSGLEVEDIEMSEELDEKEDGNKEQALQQIESDLPPGEIIGLEFMESEQIEEDMPDEKMEEDFERSGEEKELYEEMPMEVEPQHKPVKQHNQCYRLYHCIQAAVAKIAEKDETKKEWAAHRIRVLLDLIPQNPQFPLDDQTFYGALVKQIVILLKERDNIKNDRQWVLNEALNGRNLQSGGTFQNVLSRRLDEVIIPVFSAILSFVDRYSNLDLLRNRGERTPLQHLWLQIFTNDKLCQFSYDAIAMGKSEDIHPGGQQYREDFHCQFPFFWLIKEAIDSKWDNAKAVTGGHEQQVHKQLCELLEDDPVAVVLREVDISHWEELYQLYLQDFLRSVHRVPHHMIKEEYEIIGRALHTIVTGPDLTSRSPSLLSQLVAVHVAYQHSKKEIMWFGQITSHLPGVLVQLGNTIEQYNQHMELHLHAVKVALEHLTIPLEKENRKYIQSRLIKIQLCQNAIDSILTLSQGNEMAEEIRCAWHSVRVVQLFVEHLVIKYEDLANYARRIMLYMKKNSDFTKASTIENVQKTLRVMDGELENKKEYKALRPDMQEIRGHCKSFFMEVVSSLCFGQPKPPEPALIRELLTLVFTEKDETKEFSYSDKIKTDRVPVIRSFLLQLLLEHNTDDVKRYLDDYISKSRHIIKDDQNLCLLCIQCLEDAIYKQYSHFSLQERIPHAQQLLHEGVEALRTHPNHSLEEENINLAYLEGVAKLRFAKFVVGELLHCQLEGKGKRHYTHEALLFIQAAKGCCEDQIINVEDAGPGIFLVKQIVRQYGMTFLMNLISDRSMEWVVPDHLRRSEEEQQQTSDPFVIYNPIYGNIRTQLTDAVYGMEVEEIQKTLGKLTAKEAVPYMLALYQVVTLSHVHVDEVKMVKDEAKTEIDKFTKKCSFLNRELMWSAQSLIQNTHCENLEPMLPTPRQNPQNRILADVIVHAAIVFKSNSALKILQPFVKMLSSPGDLKRAYLPTMPDDSLPEVRRAMGGHFYECPRGHPYFVSECGRPVQAYTCPICGSGIGGVNHALNTTNRDARTNDTTQTGYSLGGPGQRVALPTPERTLSPAACAVLRALMHCSLVWAACNNETATEGLLDLINSQVRPREIPMFFWQHLQHDINLLSRATGKSKDEACLLLHLVIRNVAVKNAAQSSGMDTYSTLLAKEAREKWEKCFNDAYIQPTLRQLDKSLREATQLLINDKKEDRDRLFYMVYERVTVSPNTILPHLWSYRSRITLEHLSQTLSTQKHPILNEFLKQEPILRATQYIPGIVQLQQQLHDLYHRRLDKTEAAQITVGDFVRGLRIEHKKKLFLKKMNCVKTAWTLVKDKLPEYARVRVPPEYLQKITWNDSLPLSYLIPTLTGPGVCTVALVDLLVGAHNEFIEKCHSVLKKKQNTEWRKHKIPVSHIQQCHLLDYEHHLLSIVLSHCHYSLRHGKGQDVTYDYPALEKHLVDRFIHGKPLIQLEIPQVVYRKDVYSAMTFANIRKKVKPQVKLGDREQKDIINELRTTQNLRHCLDDVEIIIGFLSSGGADANIELRTYVKRALKMEDRFRSKKALEYCCLGHILSLWETLSVQMSKNLTLAKQEPFDSLHEIFLQPLETKDEGDEDQIGELNRFLRGIDLSPFLSLLYEFIETNVRHLDAQNKDWPLIDTLEAHLDQYGLDPLSPDIAKRFPESITVSQAVATWKAIVSYQQHYEREINF